jgi:hypothetical protein
MAQEESIYLEKALESLVSPVSNKGCFYDGPAMMRDYLEFVSASGSSLHRRLGCQAARFARKGYTHIYIKKGERLYPPSSKPGRVPTCFTGMTR